MATTERDYYELLQVPRGASEQEEPAGDRDVDDERIDRRAHRIAQSFGETVDQVGHAEADRETPLRPGRVEDRVQDRRAPDPVKPGAARTAPLQQLEAKKIAAADGRTGRIGRARERRRQSGLRSEDRLAVDVQRWLVVRDTRDDDSENVSRDARDVTIGLRCLVETLEPSPVEDDADAKERRPVDDNAVLPAGCFGDRPLDDTSHGWQMMRPKAPATW